MLASHDRTNFTTLLSAFLHEHVCLMEVRRVHDDKPVAAICAVSHVDGDYVITPFAIMVEGNPFDLFDPPNPDGGFQSQEDSP